MRTIFRSFLILASFAAATVATSACGHDESCHETNCLAVDANPNAPDGAAAVIVDETRTLAAGEIIESIWNGGPGDTMSFTLAAPVATLGWNIHGHANGETQVIDEALGVDSADKTFAPTALADWFLLIRNSSAAPLEVTIHLEFNGGTWSGWEK